MKICRILCLGVALVIPQLAMAKLPMPNEAFGRIEGTLDFCAQADPQAASQYQELKKAIVGDASEQEVTEARTTQEYKDGYKEVSDQLVKMPKDKAVQACTAYRQGK
jgi:hypothetical protein